jgi:hypothetical protein
VDTKETKPMKGLLQVICLANDVTGFAKSYVSVIVGMGMVWFWRKIEPN